MANILYLVHRLPYPPNKGDKVRSYHLLKYLVAKHKVHLGTFIDDPEDDTHLPVLSAMCESVHAERLLPRTARLASLAGLLNGESLTFHYYRSAAMRHWVADVLRHQPIDVCVVFSSSMAQYVEPHAGLPVLLDMVDVDSAKWAEYGIQHRWPMSWLYKREANKLLECERRAVQRAQVSYLATSKEVELFRQLAPESSGMVEPLNNGVDTEYFKPDASRARPFDDDEVPIVFTGAMDYWPNVDAVKWFAAAVLPKLRQAIPRVRFHIIGRAPTADVRALAADPGAGVVVSGTVPDVRPYLQHAAVVVAPLRLARGIQNKILEAMAMQRPVVAARACVEAMTAQHGRDLLAAESADEYTQAILRLMKEPELASTTGGAGRTHVLERYSWAAHLSQFDRAIARGLLPALPAGGAMPAAQGGRA